MSSRLAITLCVALLIAITPTSAFALAPPSHPVTATNSSPQLKVSVSPPTLPADGGDYRSIYAEVQTAKGDPLAAPRNITITLTSSILEVGSVEPTLVVPEGQTYAAADFRTSLTPGSTNITATAPGIMAASVKITTVSPSGSAVKLGVFPSPPSLLPQIGSTGRVFVQLLDAGGKPARASTTLSVALASSSPNVADVTQRIVIHMGQTYGSATATVAFISGTTTITASASGLATGFAQLSVEGQNPSKLYVKVAPDVLAPTTGEQAVVAIQLQSQDGAPTPAPQDIMVHITSSNTTVGVVIGSDIKIQAGQSYTTTSFLALNKGSSVISATTQSYASGFFVVQVVKPGNTARGGHLALIPALPVVLPDRGYYVVMVAQLRNSTGFPSFAPSNVIVSLASSNTFVGTADDLLTIRAGRTFGTAGFYSTLAPGTTNITASASNFVSASAIMTSAGPIPSRIAVITGPSILIANGSSYSTTAVQLQDVQGNPAKAPTDITVTLTSSSTDVGDVTRAATIPAGAAHAYVTFNSTLISGDTTITATAPGYVPGQASLTTTPPAQSRLGVYVDPKLLPADGRQHSSLTIQLQDQGGLPAKAALPVNVTLVSSDPAVANVEPSLQIPTGSTFMVANVTVSDLNGSATITAQAPGLVSASLLVKTVVLPLNAVVKVASPPPILTLSPVKVTLNVTSGPYPVPNAELTWSTDSSAARITDASPRTDATGGATAVLNFADAGNATVMVKISKGGYGDRLAAAKVDVRLQRLVLSIIPDSLDIGAGAKTNITAVVTSNGKPVAGVPVSWSTSAGSIQPAVSVTDSQGQTLVTFSSGSGTANVTASVSAVGYAPAAQSAQISVGGYLGAFGLIVPAVAVIVVVVLSLFFIRRRGVPPVLARVWKSIRAKPATEEEEGGEDDEEEEE